MWANVIVIIWSFVFHCLLSFHIAMNLVHQVQPNQPNQNLRVLVLLTYYNSWRKVQYRKNAHLCKHVKQCKYLEETNSIKKLKWMIWISGYVKAPSVPPNFLPMQLVNKPRKVGESGILRGSERNVWMRWKCKSNA